MAVQDCLIGTEEANSFLAADANRISGRIARSLAINNPWMNVLETGTFASNTSDIQRSVVQEAIAPSNSQCVPNWAPFSCNIAPATVCYGTTEYQYTVERYFEKSCPFCLQSTFSSFRNGIRMVEMAYTDHISTLWSSKIRGAILTNSGTKIVADSSGTSMAALVATGYQTNFRAGLTPDSPLTFRFLKNIMDYMVNTQLAGNEFQWGSGNLRHARLITDQATINNFRDEDSVRRDLRFIASGCCDQKSNLTEYSWEGPYQGIMFAVDQAITRASGVNAEGEICCIEPFITADATNGTKRQVNPAWLAAPYQVSYLMFKESFIREIPAEWLGEGLTKFERQNWGGKLTWHNVIDNCTNITGNQGFHYWQLGAAFRPVRPEFAVAILHTRCVEDLGLTACTPQGYYSACV